MTSPVLMTEGPERAGLPEQGLALCEACKAVNLPGSNYCCLCGLPLPGGALDAETRAEVEALVTQARQLASGGPVWAEAGDSFHSRVHAETVSLWPATLGSPNFQSDPWAGLGSVENACVLLIERLTGPVAAVVPLLETVVKAGKSLVVVTGAIDDDVLATFVVNHVRGTLRSLVLVLSPPAETHPALLGDLAAVLRGKVVERSRLEKATAGGLPSVREVFAGGECAWACDVSPLPPPALEGDPAVSAARRAIYGRPAARIEIGANSRAGIEMRRRYACRLLRSPAVERSGQVTAAPSRRVRAD